MRTFGAINLLPEEDVLDDPEDDDEADPNVPGDLWFRHGVRRVRHRRAGEAIVYSLLERTVAFEARKRVNNL
jgi:hypothetical protein